MLPEAKKSFGQNFLNDPRVVGKIIAAAELKEGERVLEIGPGTGVLTEGLVEAGANVTAVELDKDLIPALQEKFGRSIELINADVLTLPHEQLSALGTYKLIANIPYNITSEIIQKFLTAKSPPERLVLMVQREVADRITAQPPDMSLLAVACQLYAECEKVCNVPAGSFRPIPKVDSAVMRLISRRFPLLEELNLDPEAVMRLARIGFASKRKQLHKNIASSGKASSEEAKNALESLGLDPRVRAEVLTVENWVRLAKVFHY